jgi:hypothetical protein
MNNLNSMQGGTPSQQVHHEPTESREDVLVGIRNKMQIEIALRHGSLDDFLVKHAKTFKEFAEEHPEIFDEYVRDKDATLEKVEKIIYH